MRHWVRFTALMGKRGRNGGGSAAGVGIDFLGYVFTPTRVRLRKRTKKRFARKVKEVKNGKRRAEILASYWGWCKWGDCKRLWITVTDNDMSFAEKGITVTDNRYFEVPTERLGDIVNVPVTVLDFCLGVRTANGKDRCCVLAEHNGRRFKFITNSSSIKEVLRKAKEAEDEGERIFPVENVIVRRRQLADGRCIFYFEE